MAKEAKNGSARKGGGRATEEDRRVALVMRVPKDAFEYITRQAGDKPRTAFVREVLAKGDATLGKILAAE